MNTASALHRLRAPALFAISGVLALGVDMGVLWALQGALGPYAARGLSFLAAATFTWAFNRQLTFLGPRPLGLAAEYASYLGSMALGGAVNLGVYSAAVRWWPLVTAQPLIGVALGSLSGMAVNYLSARRILLAAR